jgi:hypothetical protein
MKLPNPVSTIITAAKIEIVRLALLMRFLLELSDRLRSRPQAGVCSLMAGVAAGCCVRTLLGARDSAIRKTPWWRGPAVEEVARLAPAMSADQFLRIPAAVHWRSRKQCIGMKRQQRENVAI